MADKARQLANLKTSVPGSKRWAAAVCEVLDDFATEHGTLEAALSEIANWDFGTYAPSADEDAMVKTARTALASIGQKP